MKSRAPLCVLVAAVGLVALLAPDAGAAIGNKQKFGFGLQKTCTGCHGLPPVALEDVPAILGAGKTCTDLESSTRNERCQNYVGGGGPHWAHVEFIRSKVPNPTLDQQCGPCHGFNPGGACWHLESQTLQPTFNWATGFYSWPATFQQKVDVAEGYTNLRAGSSTNTGIYTGGAGAGAQTIFSNPDPAAAGCPQAANGAKGGTPQRCSNINCHGAAGPYHAGPPPAGPGGDISTANYYYLSGLSAPSVPGANDYPKTMALRWYYGAARTSTDWVSDLACAGCHGSAPAMDVPGTPDHAADPATVLTAGSYTSSLAAQGVAANYFGTVSGFARGGHGDAAIESETPTIDSAPSSQAPSGQDKTPLRCTACHDDAAAHFPPATTNLVTRYRLKAGTVLEAGPPGTSGLCNTCHPRAQYPGEATSNPGPASKQHHRSYYYYNGSTSTDVIPKPGTKVLLGPPPAGYSASGAAWQTDFFSNFWGTENQFGSPPAVLPLEQYVAGVSSSNKVMCVTCHNPHGTDLHAASSSASDRSIPDNNMLRLRDEDNTLCEGCH